MFLPEIITFCSYSIVQHHFGLKYSFPGVRSQDEKSWKFHVCGGGGDIFWNYTLFRRVSINQIGYFSQDRNIGWYPYLAQKLLKKKVIS